MFAAVIQEGFHMWKAIKPGLHIFCSLLVKLKAITAVKFLSDSNSFH